MPKAIVRCAWCESDPLLVDYHDHEWGVPVHDETKLFEHLILDGAQAGLSWLTILKRREGYRKAFANYDAQKVARFTERDVQRLMQDTGIIRNQLKIRSCITNAQAFLKVQDEIGSFDKYIWSFVDGVPIQNRRKSMKDLPAETAESKAMSKDLRRRGFKFVGATICYAFMQASGMVNDHVTSCFRHKTLSR